MTVRQDFRAHLWLDKDHQAAALQVSWNGLARSIAADTGGSPECRFGSSGFQRVDDLNMFPPTCQFQWALIVQNPEYVIIEQLLRSRHQPGIKLNFGSHHGTIFVFHYCNTSWLLTPKFQVPPGATAENHCLEASIAVSKAAMATGDAGTSWAWF